MKRKPPSLKVKLASTLLEMKRWDDEESTYVPVIDYEESKSMTADQIIARFHFDHTVAHAHDGPAEPWNLKPTPVEEHRKKTAKIDIPRIAKGKRIALKERQRLERRVTGERKLRSKIPSRPFPKVHRPLRSRSSLSRVSGS